MNLFSPWGPAVIISGRLFCATAVGFGLAGCSAPQELTAPIADAQSILADTIQSLEPRLAARAAGELEFAEAVAARNGTLVVDLSGDCILASVDLGIDVSDCVVTSNAVPDDGPLNATQVRNALGALAAYFTVLHDLTTTEAPTEIRARGEALVAELNEFRQTDSLVSLNRLATGAARYGPAAAASLGFIAEQARLAAIQRTIRRADPVIESLVRGMQPLLLEMGDPVADRRLEVNDAYLAVQDARLAGEPDALLGAVARLRGAVAAMHRADEASELRRLYLLRDLNSAMLSGLSHGSSLVELERVTGQLAEITTLLEREP